MAHRTTSRRRADTAHYEFRVMTLPRNVGYGQARKLLADEAEYGRWEVARSALYVGGTRKVWLRRKIFRVSSTL